MMISFKKYRFHRFALLLSAALCLNLSAQQDISISSKVDKSTITIGDLVFYSVEVKRSADFEVIMPELGSNLGAFELRDYKVHEPVSENGLLVDRVDYTISTFDVGEFVIPSMTFFYLQKGDSVRQELQTQPISITVKSMTPSESGDIKDIKQPLELTEDYRKMIVWGSIAFAALLIALISIYIWRRRRAGKGILPQKVEPPRPAHEIALEALDALKASALLAEGQIKAYYVTLSEIIRKYIEGRYFIIALEMTTEDLLMQLQGADVDAETVSSIREFLSVCDLVKFAKHHPNDDQHVRILDSAYNLIDRTKLLYDVPLVEEPESKVQAEVAQGQEVAEEV